MKLLGIINPEMEELLKQEGITEDSMQGKIKKMRDTIMEKRDVIPIEEKESPSMETVISIRFKLYIGSINRSMWMTCRKRHIAW